MSSGYIYLFRKHKDGRITKIATQYVGEMAKVEKALHNRFAAQRIKLTKSSKAPWNKSIVKIGLSIDPNRRLGEVNEDPYNDGSTEYFILDRHQIKEAKRFLKEGKSIARTKQEKEGIGLLWLTAACIALLLFFHEEVREKGEEGNRFKELVIEINREDKKYKYHEQILSTQNSKEDNRLGHSKE